MTYSVAALRSASHPTRAAIAVSSNDGGAPDALAANFAKSPIKTG